MTKYAPTLRTRERHLVFGPAGAGKSEACFTVAKVVPGDVYVIDNDMSWERMIELDPEGGEINLNLTEIFADDWKPLIEAVKEAAKDGSKDDLLVVDSMTPTWQAVQEEFTNEIFGDDIDSYFIKARKEQEDRGKGGGSLDAFDGWKDWQVINKMYSRLYREIARFPGHVMLTAEVDAVTGGEDDDLKGIFGPYRVKPRGQKRLAHTVNTAVLLKKARQGDFTMTVCKDRGRERDEQIENEKFSNYAEEMMIGVAGWKPAGKEGE